MITAKTISKKGGNRLLFLFYPVASLSNYLVNYSNDIHVQ